MISWKKFFNIREDSASFSELNERIESDASVKGANLIVLITAILIASVGLNMDSTAVIIGAMLISPLMGGLIATGYGMATYDTHFIKESMTKLFFQVNVSLIASAIYFLLSPISDASSEILTRTSPTVWDVIIALCGGIAGAIGNTREEKNNVVPGVAIATALMPPLCTAGYGISIGSYSFFFGAMYLFFINAFFISLSAYFIFKLLRVPPVVYPDQEHKSYQKIILIVLGFVVTIPSIYMAYLTVGDNIREQQIKTFISKEIDHTSMSVISYSYDDKVLTLDIIGRPVSETELEELQVALSSYSRLIDSTVHIMQGSMNTINEEQMNAMIGNNLKHMMSNEQGKSYKELATLYYPAYKRALVEEKLTERINSELPLLFPEVSGANVGLLTTMDEDNKVSYKELLVKLQVNSELSPSNIEKIKRWVESQSEWPVEIIV
ncbi:MAG: TIGR00341 family protein [Veillonella caviae]|nr:TIGR00341 family protein [Veillonella caviae]